MHSDSPYALKTLPMTVNNTGFMVDTLGKDCAPLQFLRELTQNSIEAILATSERRGDIVWDVDWDMYDLTGTYKLCITDTGCGMTGEEMGRFINQLSSSIHNQSFDGNFGVGAKIAAATRNHAGLVYLSWKAGEGAMIHLWRDPVTGEYGLQQLLRPDGTYGHWATISDDVKPRDAVKLADHGTKVVLLGNTDDADTMSPPDASVSAASRWVSRYLNTRYFRFPEGVTVRAREGWEHPRADTDRNVLRRITGQEAYLNTHKQASGNVTLKGGVAHWWVLKDEAALTQNSGNLNSSGHIAALYDNELYEVMTGRGGVARLQMFGVVYGYPRVVIYVEPTADGATLLAANTQRTQLHVDGEPLPWAEWASEFRANLPAPIRDLMEEITAGATATDHRQAIRERLKQIRALFQFSRYRPSPKGDKIIADDPLVGSGYQPTGSTRSGSGRGGRSGPGGGQGHASIYTLFLAETGQPAVAVRGTAEPDVTWVTAAEGTRPDGYLEDRAACYLREQHLLQVNGDFRGFTDMVDRWCEQYAHVPGARVDVTDSCREWFQQALTETVMGILALAGSREWMEDDIEKALSEQALTSAVMPRYHVDVAVKRALGAKLGTLRVS